MKLAQWELFHSHASIYWTKPGQWATSLSCHHETIQGPYWEFSENRSLLRKLYHRDVVVITQLALVGNQPAQQLLKFCESVVPPQAVRTGRTRSRGDHPRILRASCTPWLLGCPGGAKRENDENQ